MAHILSAHSLWPFNLELLGEYISLQGNSRWQEWDAITLFCKREDCPNLGPEKRTKISKSIVLNEDSLGQIVERAMGWGILGLSTDSSGDREKSKNSFSLPKTVHNITVLGQKSQCLQIASSRHLYKRLRTSYEVSHCSLNLFYQLSRVS